MATPNQEEKIIELLHQQNPSTEATQGFMPYLSDVFCMPTGHIPDRFHLREVLGVRDVCHIEGVDWTLSMEEMIRRANLRWVSNDLKKFPVNPTGSSFVDVEFVLFGRPLKMREPYALLRDNGFRVAELPEVLKEAEKGENGFIGEFPVVCLTTWDRPVDATFVAVFDTHRSAQVHCIGSNTAEYIEKAHADDMWPRNCRFAAVREVRS